MPGIQDYEVVATIGSGSYGICQKIKRKKDSKMFVWKELDYGTMSETEKSMLVSEVNLLRELKHKYIVRYHDRIIDRSTSKLYIIMEFCEGGDLATYITRMKKDGRHTDEAFVWKICYQTIDALKECHCRSKNGRTILHRDLKPANVFLDNAHNVKLGDFGLARVLNHDTSFAKTFVGTPYYMSPEQMNLLSYNEKSDVWSLGCLLYELCVYRPPFTATSQRELASKICGGHFLRLPLRYSDDLSDVISYMLQVDEFKRPTIEKLADHPLVLKHRPSSSSRRSSQDNDEAFNQKLESLKRRELRVIEKENQTLEKEKSLKEKEKLLKDKDTILRQKEKDLKAREQTLVLREKEAESILTKARRMSDILRRSSPIPSPSLDYELGEVYSLADSVSDDSSLNLTDPNLSSIQTLNSCLTKKSTPPEDVDLYSSKKTVSFSLDKENRLPPYSVAKVNDVKSIQRQLDLEHYHNLLDLKVNARLDDNTKEIFSSNVRTLATGVRLGLRENRMYGTDRRDSGVPVGTNIESDYALKYHRRKAAWRY